MEEAATAIVRERKEAATLLLVATGRRDHRRLQQARGRALVTHHDNSSVLLVPPEALLSCQCSCLCEPRAIFAHVSMRPPNAARSQSTDGRSLSPHRDLLVGAPA